MFSIINELTNLSILVQNYLGRVSPALIKVKPISRGEEVKLKIGYHP